MDPSRFYDDLAEYYDLIYQDWARSVEHQGRAIAQVLDRTFPERERHSVRVLDVSAGIGTQTIPLAQAGYQVTARDISPARTAARMLELLTIRPSSCTGGHTSMV